MSKKKLAAIVVEETESQAKRKEKVGGVWGECNPKLPDFFFVLLVGFSSLIPKTETPCYIYGCTILHEMEFIFKQPWSSSCALHGMGVTLYLF